MLNTSRSGQFSYIFKSFQKNNFYRPLYILIIVILRLFMVFASRHHPPSQPLTVSQHAILSGLVGEVSKKTNQTRQKVWSHLKSTLGVRRIQDITQDDFNRAQEILLLKLK
ncbi:MAG: hypothetical protein H7832_15550 [Magnetococcus sp. DMHC-6]